jgi:GAF domain-containing protein
LNWGPRVAQATGARSSFSVRLFTVQDTLGALNMYSSTAAAFSAEDQQEGLAIAAHIAVAVAAAQNLEQLETALDSRTIIAQACGLVMERFDIDSIRAFALLTRLSSTQNVKLRDIAAELVLTRLFPTSPGPGRGLGRTGSFVLRQRRARRRHVHDDGDDEDTPVCLTLD